MVNENSPSKEEKKMKFVSKMTALTVMGIVMIWGSGVMATLPEKDGCKFEFVNFTAKPLLTRIKDLPQGDAPYMDSNQPKAASFFDDLSYATLSKKSGWYNDLRPAIYFEY